MYNLFISEVAVNERTTWKCYIFPNTASQKIRTDGNPHASFIVNFHLFKECHTLKKQNFKMKEV